jgi:hypothetical protein
LNQTESERGSEASALVQRHLVLGWTFLLVFLTLGIVLEGFHGLKVRWYVDVQNSTRRLMWTLAHSHGVLIGLVSLGFALTAHLRPDARKGRSLASTLLFLSALLLPGGFFLGGIVIHQGDPGIGVFLTPFGGLALLLSVGLTLRGLSGR